MSDRGRARRQEIHFPLTHLHNSQDNDDTSPGRTKAHKTMTKSARKGRKVQKFRGGACFWMLLLRVNDPFLTILEGGVDFFFVVTVGAETKIQGALASAETSLIQSNQISQ